MPPPSAGRVRSHDSGGFSGLAGCLFWASLTTPTGGGNFYSGSSYSPVDMCMHLFGDLNWGDMVNCANDVCHKCDYPLPKYRMGMVYPMLLSSITTASARGVTEGRSVLFVNGQKSLWPNYDKHPAGPRTLVAEACAALVASGGSPSQPTCAPEHPWLCCPPLPACVAALEKGCAGLSGVQCQACVGDHQHDLREASVAIWSRFRCLWRR